MNKEYKLAIVLNAIDKATGVLGRVGGVVKGLGAVAAGLGTVGLAGVTALGIGLGSLAVQAAPLEGITQSFRNLAQQTGRTADEMLDSMRAASVGVIKDSDLMKQANLALTGAGEQLGREFGDKLPKLLEIARASARATGQDADFMFQSLVTGIKRTSPMVIDNTGLQLKLGEANETLATALGKTVEELTKEEQQIALLNATVEAGQGLINSVGLEGMTSAEMLAKLNATIGNLKDRVGTAFLPVLLRLTQMLSDLAEKYGPKIAAFAENAGTTLAGLIDELVVAIEGGWPAIMAKLEEWGQRFWDWVTGPGGAAESAGLSLQKVIDSVSTWFDENWPIISGKLSEWGQRFWQWIETDVVPVAMEKLEAVSEAIRVWAESPDTQAKLAEIGETTGRGLVEGARLLLGAAETWTPIIVELCGALAEAAATAGLPAVRAIGEGLADGILRGAMEALGREVPEYAGGLEILAPGLFKPPGYQYGGVVPGPTGRAQLAMVHGGETITPPGRGGGGGRIVVEHLCPECLRRTVSEQMNQELDRASPAAWRR